MTCHGITVVRSLILSSGPFVRFAMGLAALATAGMLLWPKLGEGVFARPSYLLLALLAEQWVFGLAFAVYGVGAWWRLLDQRTRKGWSLAVNVYGFFLWTGFTAALAWAIRGPAPSLALEWVGCAGLLVTIATDLYRAPKPCCITP